MGAMTSPELTPRSPLAGMIATWAFGALAAVAVGLLSPLGERFLWLAVGAGACVFVAFAVNLAYGRAEGFIVRTAVAALGALVAMGVIAFVFFLVSITALVASV